MSISFMRGGGATSELPLHRLDYNQTIIWMKILGEAPRRLMAANLAKKYPAGCGVCTDTGKHVGNVDPKGNPVDLPPPHNRYRPWQYANKPKALECPCAEFMDPENNGLPWKERGSEEHHPLCQHDRTAIAVFLDKDRIGVQNPFLVMHRPDLWIKAREHYRGK